MHLPSVDLIRLLATASIFLFHLWSAVPAGVESRWLADLLSQGYLGVVVFDVIAGLVAALPYLGSGARAPVSHARFVRQRFLRLTPQYWTALLAWGALSDAGLIALVAHLAFVQTLSPSWFFSIVPAFWWLGLVAQFSLAFPWLLWSFLRFGALRASAGLCGASWLTWTVLSQLAAELPGSSLALVNYMGYYNLPYRLPEFVIGMAIAAWLRAGAEKGAIVAGRRGLAAPLVALASGPLVVGVGGLWIGNDSTLPGRHAVLVVLCTLGLVGLLRAGAAVRVGSLLGVRRFAALSYGFYLTHQPVLAIGVDFLRPLFGDVWTFRALLPIAAAISLGLAVLLERFEQALLRRWSIKISG